MATELLTEVVDSTEVIKKSNESNEINESTQHNDNINNKMNDGTLDDDESESSSSDDDNDDCKLPTLGYIASNKSMDDESDEEKEVYMDEWQCQQCTLIQASIAK